MLDVRRLRVLLAVREHGGVAAAARALAFTPSAVSQQLTALERQVGRPLLDRTGQRARLTAAGERLAGHAAAVLARLEAAEAEVAAGAEEVEGTVRVASIPTVAHAVLVPAVRALAASAPALAVGVEQVEPEASLPALVRGEVDLVLASEYGTTPSRPDRRVAREDLFTEDVLVALPAGHPALGRLVDGALPLAALRDEPWLAPAVGSSCGTMLDRACAAAGFAPAVVGRCADFDLAAALVGASGRGCCIVPRVAADRPGAVPDGVRLVPARDPAVTRTVYAATRRGGAGHPAVAALLAALRRAVRDRGPARGPDLDEQGSPRIRGEGFHEAQTMT